MQNPRVLPAPPPLLGTWLLNGSFAFFYVMFIEENCGLHLKSTVWEHISFLEVAT